MIEKERERQRTGGKIIDKLNVQGKWRTEKKSRGMEKERSEQGLTIEGFKERKPRGEFGQRLEGVRGLTMRGEKDD